MTLNNLDEPSLIRILTEPKNALIKQYQKLFELDDVKLEFTDEALKAIAHRAVERKTGARGLRSIIENVMTDIMYEIPSEENIGIVTITKVCVENDAAPDIVYRNIPDTDEKQVGSISRNIADTIKKIAGTDIA